MARDPARIATEDPVDPLRTALGNIAKAQESAKATAAELATQRFAPETESESEAE